ncbi:MAG: hypothetical protein Altm2KO_05750 [Alteromonas macleodii]
MVKANSRTAAADTRAARIRPNRVKIKMTGMAKTADRNTSVEGKVPNGIMARRISEVTLNTASSVILISLIGQVCR